jgi:hypothetical protein
MPMARGRQARHSQANTCLMRVKVKGGPDCSCIYTTRSPLCNCTQVPPGRLERPHTAPEAAALSTELRGLVASSVPQAGTIGKRVRPSTNVTRIHEYTNTRMAHVDIRVFARTSWMALQIRTHPRAVPSKWIPIFDLPRPYHHPPRSHAAPSPGHLECAPTAPGPPRAPFALTRQPVRSR